MKTRKRTKEDGLHTPHFKKSLEEARTQIKQGKYVSLEDLKTED